MFVFLFSFFFVCFLLILLLPYLNSNSEFKIRHTKSLYTNKYHFKDLSPCTHQHLKHICWKRRDLWFISMLARTFSIEAKNVKLIVIVSGIVGQNSQKNILQNGTDAVGYVGGICQKISL